MKFKNNVITYSTHSYINFDCDAGSARVNVCTNEVIFTHNDISTGEGTFNMGISHIHSNYSHLDETHMGLGWKLNIQHYLKKYDGSVPLADFTTDDYLYVDGEGYIHRFVKFDDNRYVDQSGQGMILTLSIMNQIKMPNGNVLSFNSDGNLCMIVIKCKNKDITRNIEYDGQYIKKYYDSRCSGDKERYFSFDYENGLLNKISLVSKGKVLETIFYKYNNGNLQGIYHFINNALNSISLFKYELGKIIFATGTSNGIALGLKYINYSVVVNKGLSKIKKSAYDCLNDDIKAGEIYSNAFIEPTIGAKNASKGLFIVKNLNDGLYYLGDEIAFENLHDDLILNDSYEAFAISENDTFEITKLEYSSNYFTNIRSNKGLKYRYYYNHKGFVTSTFEVDGENLMTLTKDSGIAISSSVNDSCGYERINNKEAVTQNLNSKLYCLDSNKTINRFDGGRRLRDYRDSLGNNYVNFTASFWIKFSSSNVSYLKVIFEIFHMNWIKKEVYIDHTASDAWQFVTIPFSIKNDNQSKSYDFTSASINAGSDGVGNYTISNLRIEEGIHSKLQLSGNYLTYDTSTISEYYKVRLVLSNGNSREIIFDNNNFITESDVFATCKNMNKSKIFDFVYCANTKRIPHVKSVFFRVFEDQRYSAYSDEYGLYGIDYLNITSRSPDASVDTKKNYYYDSAGNLVEHTYSGLYGESTNVLDDQGRIISKIDSHKKKTVNEYDDYGNIISSTTALSENFDNNNKVIIGKPRLYTRYHYDDESGGGVYREMVVNTSFQDSTIKVRKNQQMVNTVESIQVGDNYAQNYSYDVLNRIKELSVTYDFGKTIRNCFEYDNLGRLKSVSDSSKFCYELDYDKYGNISKYYLRIKDGTLKTLKSKETIPNGSSYGGDKQIETNNLTKSSIITENDKYGRPMKTVFKNNNSEKTVLYEFQKHNDSINSNCYQTNLNESPSISKIKKIEDGCDNSTTTFFYDNKNDDCGYTINRNGIEIQRMQQMDSNNTKYVLGTTKYKTTIEREDDLENPRVIKSSVSWDYDSDAKDEWNEVKNYSFTYTYDDVLGVPISKTGSLISTEVSYIPNNNTTYYSNLVQNHLSTIGSKKYNYAYQYDSNQNLHRIITGQDGKNDITYSYDKLNRLKSEYNERQNINYTYSYLDDNNNDVNRITKVIDGTTKVKEFTYDELNRLTKYSKYGTIKISLMYGGRDLNPACICKNGTQSVLAWSRDNLLTKYGNNSYNYNYQGNRVSKITNSKTINYYYDGSKLLGEDHSDGVKIRYIYDLMGISGARYIKNNKITDYIYVKDGQNNVVAISRAGYVVAEYYYDAWGNTLEQIMDSTDPFVKINPFRWKCNYYDIETNMYYINGRYYDPELLTYISPLDVEEVVSNYGTLGGLNPYSICTDNPTDLGSIDYTVLTNTEFMPDPVYDPLVGHSWWDKNWKNVIRYGLFSLTFITSIVLMCIPGTQAFGIGMFEAGLGAALSGMVIGGVINGIVSAIQGNGFFTGFADGAITGFVDGFTSGAVLYCITSAISAISKAIKASNQACAKPGQCFVAGTLVLTEYGYKAIEEIEIGDKVWSWCEETGEKVLNNVTALFRNQTKDLVHLSISGEEITTTKGHPFYVVDYGWKEACKLQQNDKVVMYDDTIVTVDYVSYEHTYQEINVYNFEVENAHTYYVTDKNILVHNLCAEGKALAKAKEAGIDVQYADDLAGEFSDEALDYLNNVKHRANGTTISDHVTGTKIHHGFMGNGEKITMSPFRCDGFRDGIIYELKPYNARNIRKAVKQLIKYRYEYERIGKTVTKLVLVLY